MDNKKNTFSEEEKNEVERILASITNKRARVVIEHIQKHGQITTEDLSKYGYNHPPRAARDVREAGIPLETIRVQSTDGRSIAAYKFGNLYQINKGKLAGRKTFSKSLRKSLYETQEGKCAICSTHYEDRYLQVDHRIPYEIAGELFGIDDPSIFMMLCGSCNRAKSWSCEHCINWQSLKETKNCASCYWAHPERYLHVALSNERRIELTWKDDEIYDFERVSDRASRSNVSISQFIKRLISIFVKEK